MFFVIEISTGFAAIPVPDSRGSRNQSIVYLPSLPIVSQNMTNQHLNSPFHVRRRLVATDEHAVLFHSRPRAGLEFSPGLAIKQVSASVLGFCRCVQSEEA